MTLTSRLPAPGATAVMAWSVWALLLGMGLLMVGNGMQGTLLGVRATDEGFSGTVTGVVMSGYFVGFLGGAFLTPLAIQRVGHVRVFAAMAALASVAILVHAMLVTPTVWGAMRVLTGLAYSGLYIVAESWLNDRASNAMRGRLLSIYLVVTYVSMGGGQLMMNVASTNGYALFLLNSVILSLAVVPILLSVTRQPDNSGPEPLGIIRLYRISPLGTVGSFATGMGHGAIFSMAAVVVRGYGLSVAEVSLFMAALIAGGAVLQWPIGRLSDRIDRRRVIAGTAIAVALVAALGIPVAAFSNAGLIAIGALLGGTALPMYSLYVAHTNDQLQPSQMVAASSGLFKAVSAGAILGPLLTGWITDLAGPGGFFWYLIAIHLASAVYALYCMARSEAPAVDEQSPYAPVPGRTGELAGSWVEERASADAPDAGAAGAEVEDRARACGRQVTDPG